MKGINTYGTTKELTCHSSVTRFFQAEREQSFYLEVIDTKLINYYVFQAKEEVYFRKGVQVKYTR